ncbi:MAG: type IV pilus assembly protein PilM [Patescibacteria group bacterium]|jgi:type IV pilus assembly protein PilM|nr:type IV pilus assembly protein PilM [Patescibacteria group bacterium]
MDFNFKTDPIWKPHDIVGIDIGTRSVKAVQLKKKGKLTKLVGYGRLEVPENYIIEGIISEPEKLAGLIKDFFKKITWGKITATRVNLSISESKVFTRILTLPHTDDKSRSDAVIWEATQIVPMAMDDLYIDWQYIGPNNEDPKSDDIIFAAAPKSIVNSYIQLAGLLGLEIISIETNLGAVARAMVPNKAIGETVLVVDLGAKSTSMAIFDQYIRVTGSTLVGGENLTKKIAEVLKLEINEAERLKLKKDDKDLVKVREAIDVELTDMTREIDRMIHYYYEKINKENIISKILLCGGTASLPGLSEYFTEKLDITTVVGNPWSNISVYPIKPVPREEAPIYTNAIGLALLGFENE